MEEDKQMTEFCLKVPKVELHAHINGSISEATMEKLMHKKPHLNVQHSMTMIKKGQQRSLEECFEMFKVIHKLTDCEESIVMITKDVIREFHQDGVKYLELRSTPREEKSTGLTRRSYVDAVLSAIRQSKEELPGIDVRFLLAIDRRNGPAVAMETAKLAEEHLLSSGALVLGLDMSGDPSVGHGRDFLPVLEYAKKAGLKLALHLSEIPSQTEETRILMDLPPDRIGHGTFLHPDVGGSQEIVDLIIQHQTPIELCLTSNVKGKTVATYDQHHFRFWYGRGHPCIICTDDKGVFATDLSQEYHIAADTFNLSKEDLWNISYRSIDCIFLPEGEKRQLRGEWDKLKGSLLNSNK
ncbi:N6-Methyl-AMP deaminase [Lampetra fluviatilis]